MKSILDGFTECPLCHGYHNKARCPRCHSHEPANLLPANPRTTAKLECPVGDGSLAAGEAQESGPGRVHIRFVSVRKRLCDPDNLSEKWALDCLRFIGVIRGDEPDKITLETTQRKAAKGEEEFVEVTVTYPSP